MTAHGTYAGWNAHKRAGEDPCLDCLDSQRRYARDYRSRRGVGRQFTFPVETPRYDVGLGAAIAYAIRENA